MDGHSKERRRVTQKKIRRHQSIQFNPSGGTEIFKSHFKSPLTEWKFSSPTSNGTEQFSFERKECLPASPPGVHRWVTHRKGREQT